MVRIAIIADYNASSETHLATDAAFQHSSSQLNTPIETSWLATKGITESNLRNFNAFLIGPGTYENRDNVISAIQIARESKIPTLATCGGFQHMILEYAQNVLKFKNASHEEFQPSAIDPLIVKMACSLRGQKLEIEILPDSIASSLYCTSSVAENYYCSFGINPAYVDSLFKSNLKCSGKDANGEARITELVDHPFYVGTLFVPQIQSAPNHSHPLIDRLVQAALD